MPADGTVLIDTEINTDGMEPGTKEVEDAVRRMAGEIDDLGKKAEIALQKQVASFAKANNAFQAQQKKVDELKRKIEEYGNTKIPTEQYSQAEKDIEKLNQKLDAVIEKQIKFVETGGNTKSRAFEAMEYDIENLNTQISEAISKKKQLEGSGQAFTLGKDTDQYSAMTDKYVAESQKLLNMNENLGASYSRVKNEFMEYQKRLNGVDSSQKKAEKSGKKFNKTLKDTQKSSKGAGINLKRMILYGLGVESLFTLFNRLRGSLKEGMDNLSQYSNETNAALSLLMSSLIQLKNSFATAFSPILEFVAPVLSEFINLLSDAATRVSELFSALMGKDTFAKAVKVQQDYADSLKDTSKNTKKAANETKKALAPFDDLRQIQFMETKESEEGKSLSPDQMFETKKVSDDAKDLADTFKSMIDNMKEKAKELKDLFMSGFWDGLGNYKPFLAELKSDLAKIGGYLKDIFTDANVQAAAKRFVDSFVYMVGTFIGMLTSLGLTMAVNIVGGIESYLSNNVDRIKAWIIRMFDVGTEINTIFSNFFIAFADVFSVFASQTAQDITGSIIQIFADVFGGILELTLKFTRDVLDMMLTPFVENKDKIKGALLQTLEPIKVAIQGIASAVRNAVDGIVAMYDQHIHPFFESIKNGLSELLEKLLDAYTVHIVPILDKLAAKFKEVMEGPVGDAINSAINFIGKLFDTVKWLWEEAFVPFIGWIIENIIPVIAPILETLGELILNFAASVADLISGVFDVLSGLIDFVVGVFSGDWTKAWNGAKQIFDSVWNLIIKAAQTGIENIKSLISGLLDTVKEAAKAVASLFEGKSTSQVLLGNASKLGRSAMAYSAAPQMAAYAAIPYNPPMLATGTVVPPRAGISYFGIGDNNKEPEVVSPMSTIEEAVTNALEKSGALKQSDRPLYLQIDGKTLARLLNPYMESEKTRVGVRMVTQNG